MGQSEDEPFNLNWIKRNLITGFQASNATICGLFLSVTQDDIGSEGEAFNVTLGFQNVTYKTNITLTPDWDRLKIREEIMKTMLEE